MWAAESAWAASVLQALRFRGVSVFRQLHLPPAELALGVHFGGIRRNAANRGGS
jgi:hypothetical protein